MTYKLKCKDNECKNRYQNSGRIIKQAKDTPIKLLLRRSVHRSVRYSPLNRIVSGLVYKIYQYKF